MKLITSNEIRYEMIDELVDYWFFEFTPNDIKRIIREGYVGIIEYSNEEIEEEYNRIKHISK
jgi:hypothetical protein